MNKTFHLLGLPHLPTNKQESLSCAFTQKVLKMGIMLKSLGHKVFFYGIEGSTVNCDEFIQVLNKEKLEKVMGIRTDQNQFYNQNMTENGHYNSAFLEFITNASNEINRRKTNTDFLLCAYGLGHKPIADEVKLPLTVESGIGYMDTFAQYRVFESYAWMHYLYGLQKQDDGKNYDAVIPNYFDPSDFEYSDKKQNYMLYIGRMIQRKGVEIAMQLAEQSGIMLKMAGQNCGEDVRYKDRKNVEYLGYADWNKRRELYRDAMITLVPTQYIGPFEGVSIESLLSGTPVISSDWGVFPETIIHGLVGYRCRTFDDYMWSIKNIDNIKSDTCRKYAIANYSLDRVKLMYEEYFDKLLDLFQPKGWYEIHNDRTQLDWLRKYEVGESKEFIDKTTLDIPNLNIEDNNKKNKHEEELSFWSYYPSHLCELDKQSFCAKQVGLLDQTSYVIDLQGKSVLEVGAGPNGLCLRASNGRRKIIDAADYPEWVWKRYEYFGVEYENIMAEDMNESGWDEVWLINCMQHTDNPDKVMDNIKKAGKVLRIFEWLNIPTDTNHKQSFTKEWYDKKLNICGKDIFINRPYMYTTNAYVGIYLLQIENGIKVENPIDNTLIGGLINNE